jgi:microsomal dipeptidase-like Zn-dependent dipeptidase
MINFQFSDLHCHPTLKAFGKTFSGYGNKKNQHASMWYKKPATFFTKYIQKIFGITRFSQADLITMIDGNVKIAFVSLYPFEKGFFTNPYLNDKISALLSSFVTSIGYNRVRHLQKHLDYYKDLTSEYEFLLQTPRKYIFNDIEYSFEVVKSLNNFKSCLNRNNHLSIIPTIEGAHVFNTGLGAFGKQLDEDHIIENIKKIKRLSIPPFFITFAHNFNNDLCGHAPSLECLGSMVNQNQRLNSGFTKLGIKVLHHLLSEKNGKPIFIDVKHMSLKSRLQYYDILKSDYNNSIPIIVSHGAVTGRNTLGHVTTTLDPNFFANDSINFYDEELVIIAKSNGLFALQLDAKRLGPKHIIKKSVFKINSRINLKSSALIVWRQLQHVAEVLDSKGLFAWGTCCIGSDFDGTIDPLDEVWTASNLNALANELVIIAKNYLSKPNALLQQRNKNTSAERIVSNFAIQNTLKFIEKYYLKHKPNLAYK